jgi:hypothetical protein
MWRALLFVIPLAVVGCSGGIFRTFDADKASASVDAKQRVILSGVRKTPKGEERRIVCAEPSPDAMVALAQAMSLEATVAGQGGGSVSASLAEAVAMIGKRTATIQLLRDGLYRACEAYLNGAIDDYGYALLLGQFDRLMVSMLALEGLMQLEPAPPLAVAVGGTKESASRTPLEGGSGKNSGAGNSATKNKAEETGPTTVIAQQGTRKFQKDEIAALAGPVMTIVDFFNTRGSAVVSACLMWFAREADRQVLGNPPIPDTSNYQITHLCKNHIETLMQQKTDQH